MKKGARRSGGPGSCDFPQGVDSSTDFSARRAFVHIAIYSLRTRCDEQTLERDRSQKRAFCSRRALLSVSR